MSTAAGKYKFGGWTDPRAVYNAEIWMHKRPYGAEFDERGLPLMKRKVDDHKYETEAGNLPIETCQAMWIIKFGNEPVKAVDTVDQDDLTWEIGNRLYWAGLLEHDQQMDEYTCKS